MELRLVNSSNLHMIGYDKEESVLRIVFKNGMIYDYQKVPLAMYTALNASVSKGVFFSKYIKNKFLFIRAQ